MSKSLTEGITKPEKLFTNNETLEPVLTVIDEQVFPVEHQLDVFVHTDLLIEQTDRTNNPLLHFWSFDKTIILGMKDTRVPDFYAGLDSIDRTGYSPLIRSAGGLAVVADTGVLNISLILTNSQENRLTIDSGYKIMTDLIYETLQTIIAQYSPASDLEFGVYEIPNSYCPGEFDLSIGGKKFAGIAQRRIKNGVAIMIYLSVNGNQTLRGELVRDFYRSSLKGEFGKAGFPPVDPATMANLSDLLQIKLDTTCFKKSLMQTITKRFKTKLDFKSFAEVMNTQDNYRIAYAAQLSKMQARNDLLTQWQIKKERSSKIDQI